MSRPRFEQLPLGKDDPPFSAWGLYGKDDQLGTLNLLTPEVVIEAAKEIKTGIRVGLDTPLNLLSPPSHNRLGLKHTVISKAPRPVHDDIVELNTQASKSSSLRSESRTRGLDLQRPNSAHHNGTGFDIMDTCVRSSSTMA